MLKLLHFALFVAQVLMLHVYIKLAYLVIIIIPSYTKDFIFMINHRTKILPLASLILKIINRLSEN